MTLAAFLAAAVATAHPVAELLTRREISVAGPTGPFAITAEAGLVPVASGTDGPDATAGYISYTLPLAQPDRPVLFAFNGGPGASAAFLHMGALGPVRVEVPQDPEAALPADPAAAPNDNTLLDLADLVFIDPPGTGFSDLPADADPDFYRSVTGDAAAASQLVSAWLSAHGRRDAPVYILGESYGTIRAAAMLPALAGLAPDLRVGGVILLGQALNMIETSQRPDNIISYVVSLPTLAAIACYHGKSVQPCDPAAQAREAAEFAGEEYLQALFEGRDLDSARKRQVARRLEEFSGIPADYYLAHDLRISKERFRVELLRGEGLVVGRYDARYVAPRPADAGEVVGPDAFSAVSGLYGQAMPDYLEGDLGIGGAQAYKVIVRSERPWIYGGADSPFANWPFMDLIEAGMERDEALRLFVASGIFDLTTTIGAADYLIDQSDIPADRYTVKRYEAGHVVYSDDESWRRLIADLRAFLSSASAE
ncbi:septum formation initiator [Pacificimonas flava]|uniref:Septum formation initiator n=2 Tax=Pacificimonas TaxID=1960290 RepID=A0A219B8M2_9SPHN|nr:septum formation initiator [Pacificimonas flava]